VPSPETRSRVLVTGGAKGIGGAVSRTLAAAGFDLVITYNSSRDAADTMAAELAAAHNGGEFRALGCDLSDADAVERLAAELEADEAGYFGFVHNAGMPYDTLTATVDVKQGQRAMQVNFWSFVRLSRALFRGMSRKRQGRMVAIGSVTALRGNQGNAVYAATKAALLGYVKTLAVEAARRNITANVVAPGYVDTDMLESYKEFRAKLEPQVPLGRYAKPEEIAGMVAYLLSPAAAYVTGAELTIDGGLSASLGIKR